MAKSVKKTFEKELFIIRGLPGSGKTSLANSILGTGAGIIHSSDDFFTNKKNVFHFDKLKLNEALKFNQKQCEESCSKGILRIIVDDNHVKRWSVKPIIETGKKYNYKIIIREPETTWWKTRNVNEMAKRSKHNYSTSIIKKLLEMWDTDFSIESILKEKIPDNKEEIIDQLVQNPIKSTVPGKNPQNVNNKKINSRHNHHNGPPPKGNINSGRNNYVAPKPRNLDNYRSQPYYGPGRGRDTPNSRGGSYYDRPASNSFDRGSGGRHAYKPPVSHERGYYSPPPPPPPPSSGYRNSYPPSYDRYDRNDDLPPLPPPSYDRYDRNDNPPPYYDRYSSSRGNNIYEGRDRGRNDSSLPPPPPPHNDRYSKRIGGGAPPPSIYDKYDRGSSGGNPPPQYYNRRDNPPPPPPPPMYDHRDRRTNHPSSNYDRRSKGPPPPAPRYDRRDHAAPPSTGYYDSKNDIGNRGYYGRGGSPPPPPPHSMSNPPPYNNYRGGWKRK